MVVDEPAGALLINKNISSNASQPNLTAVLSNGMNASQTCVPTFRRWGFRRKRGLAEWQQRKLWQQVEAVHGYFQAQVSCPPCSYVDTLALQ